MSSLEAGRLDHLESAITAASAKQIITIQRLAAEVALGYLAAGPGAPQWRHPDGASAPGPE
jgi:hypothetical protein